MRVAAGVLAALLLLAGCGSTRVVTRHATRPAIHAGATSGQVRANFAGKPMHHFDGAAIGAAGFTCEDYLQNQDPHTQAIGAWAVRVCWRSGPAN